MISRRHVKKGVVRAALYFSCRRSRWLKSSGRNSALVSCIGWWQPSAFPSFLFCICASILNLGCFCLQGILFLCVGVWAFPTKSASLSLPAGQAWEPPANTYVMSHTLLFSALLMGLLPTRTMAWTSTGKTHAELLNNLYSEYKQQPACRAQLYL